MYQLVIYFGTIKGVLQKHILSSTSLQKLPSSLVFQRQ